MGLQEGASPEGLQMRGVHFCLISAYQGTLQLNQNAATKQVKSFYIAIDKNH